MIAIVPLSWTLNRDSAISPGTIEERFMARMGLGVAFALIVWQARPVGAQAHRF
jgi:hypothetical protein